MLRAMRSLALAFAAGVLAAACGTTASEQQEVDLAAPSATSGPPVVASATASTGGTAPISAGAVPEAGVVYVWGADDGIYRYDGATGGLTRVFGSSTLARESAYGAYVLGLHGGTTLLAWDGTTKQVCGGGTWSVVSTRGQCAWTATAGDLALYTDSPEGGHGATLPRRLLPGDWGAGPFVWDMSGLELAIVRREARPEPVRQHSTLWVMDLRHSILRQVFDSSSGTSYLFGLRWAPLGHQLSFLEQDSTSASAAADGVNIRLHVVDVDTLRTVDLGKVIGGPSWPRWSYDGLAFVRGTDRFTWSNKQVVVWRDWRETVVAGGRATVALAPAWTERYGEPARLAWIEGPVTNECCERYVAGIGPSADRVAVLQMASGPLRMRCPGRITEGVRWSADASAVLLLCRRPGVEERALEVWDAPLGGLPRALVTGLGGLGFGYYGLQPSLLDMTAWSLADR